MTQNKTLSPFDLGGGVDEDIGQQRWLFVMTLTDVDMSNNCRKLKEASIQLSDTVKQMEVALTKQRHSMAEQASMILAAQQQQQLKQTVSPYCTSFKSHDLTSIKNNLKTKDNKSIRS